MASPTPEVIKIETDDHFTILLTRYYKTGKNSEGPNSKGPVLLVHGGSVGSQMYTISTTDQSLAAYLHEHGFDVWMIDWRVSINLPLRPCTLTDAAQFDFPEALEVIRGKTPRKSIRAVVHCIGALAFFVSVQRGWVTGVEAIASSAVGLHPIVGTVERAKTAIRLAALLADRFHMTEVSPLEDPMYPLYSIVVRALVNSVHHECTSTICHKLTFMYGHPFLHKVLNVETHERLAEQFGPINLKTLMHVEQCINLGHMADYSYGIAGNLDKYGAEGPPSFVDDASKFKDVKVSLFSGEFNQLFIPESTLATFKWLKKHNQFGAYHRELIPGYGHWDVFAGAKSKNNCYRYYLEALS